MNPMFRHLTLLFVLSILAMLSLLGWWLVQSGVQMEERMQARIYQSFHAADLHELFLRAQRAQRKTSMYFYLPQNFLPLTQGGVEQGASSITLEMQRTLHASLDSWQPLSFATIDSLLHATLQAEGIVVDWDLQLLDLSERDTLHHALHTHPSWWRIGRPSLRAQATADTLYLDEEQTRAYVLRHASLRPLIVVQLLPSALLALGLCLLLFVLFFLLLKRREAEREMTDYAHNLTHELKTPIAVALAAHEALIDFKAAHDASRRSALLNTSHRQLTRLAQLVEQALALHRHRSGSIALHPSCIDLPQLLHHLQDEHELKAEKPVSIFIQLPEQPIVLTADATHLYNVLSNLLDNAVKFSPIEAEIDLEVSLLSSPNAMVCISVRDRGIGIARRHHERVWQRFYRVPQGTRHEVRGYGLGLYYVRSLVERMGGRVQLVSELGKGTCISIFLPLSPQA